jgi:hypothetical protein
VFRGKHAFWRKPAPATDDHTSDHDDVWGAPHACHRPEKAAPPVKTVEKHPGETYPGQHNTDAGQQPASRTTDVEQPQARQATPDPAPQGRQAEAQDAPARSTDTTAPAHHQEAAGPTMAILVGGEALALGNDTITTGALTNTIKQHNNGVTIAKGDALFKAYGSSETPGDAFAFADTYLDIAGADFIFGIQMNTYTGNEYDAYAQSALKYIAIDIPNWTPPGGPITNLFTLTQIGGKLPYHAPGDGNLATVYANALVAAPNSDTATQTSALTVADQLSYISGWAWGLG